MKTFKDMVAFLESDFKEKYGINQTSQGLGFSEKEQKWYGWSHRGLCGFGIGDMLFDEDWTPDGSKPRIDNPATDKLKFTERGSIKIETLEQAKQAAENFKKYIS
jgi:hypothetical protein